MAAVEEVLEEDCYTLDKVYGLLDSGFFDNDDAREEDENQVHFDLETVNLMVEKWRF